MPTPSPIGPEQRIFIYAGAGFFALLGCWLALKAVREHFRTGKPLRLMPLALAPLGLVVGVEAVMVINGHPFFIQHPLRMPSIPMIGCLLMVAASLYDQRHAPSEEKAPSRIKSFRTRVESSLDTRYNYPPDKPLLAHLKSLLRFYLGSREVHMASRYPLEQALSRIRDLKKAGEVYISERKPNRLVVCATQVRGNVIPMFRGALTERNGKVTLDGHIEIDSGIVYVLGLFALALFVVLPLSAFVSNRPWPERLSKLLGSFIGLLMMEIGYLISKNSAEIIVRNLERALRS